MDKRGFLIGLISGYLRGDYNRPAMAELVWHALGEEMPSPNEAELLRQAEASLRQDGPPWRPLQDQQLRYFLECLKGERSFDPQHPLCSTNRPVLAIDVPLGRSVLAQVFPGRGYFGLILKTRDPELLATLRELEKERAFSEIIAWFQVRRTMVGSGPYYLLLRSRLPKFFRELKLFLETHFPGV